jgi:hypothetical protein
MKKLYIIIIGLLLLTTSCIAQLNNLNDTELFEGIRFNNVTLSQVMKSKGNLNKMKTLFGNDIEETSNNTGPYIGKNIFNTNLYFHFEDETDKGNNYDLTYIKVKNSSVTVNIKGLSIKIGNDKSKFGNLLLNTNTNRFVFTDEDTGSVSLSFQIDTTTNKIIEIKFIAY